MFLKKKMLVYYTTQYIQECDMTLNSFIIRNFCQALCYVQSMRKCLILLNNIIYTNTTLNETKPPTPRYFKGNGNNNT